jgi:hypothetical protein
MSHASDWFNYHAALKILIFSMLAGAALPGLFALGLRLGLRVAHGLRGAVCLWVAVSRPVGLCGKVQDGVPHQVGHPVRRQVGVRPQDALRRDFTINALFYNISADAIEDLTGRGVADLRAGRLVTPLPPAVPPAHGMSRADVGIFELHDAYAIMACVSLESAGFAPAGEGTGFAADGHLALGGRLPIATFGGLKARGHPVGATGVYQAAEMHRQLTRRAGANQVAGARVARACGALAAGASSRAVPPLAPAASCQPPYSSSSPSWIIVSS